MINVTVWNENSKETTGKSTLEVYPEGLNAAIRDFLKTNEDFNVRTANLEEDEYGMPDELLNSTDVLIWWGHGKHERVPDELAQKIHYRVLCGMGVIFLHSAHFSKPFRLLMGTTCSLKWREGDRERIWTVMPHHPIAKGIPEHFELEQEEMYGERFDIPAPDEQIFLGWFAGGEVFRSGNVWNRGLGKVFYFQPGHESNGSFYNEYVQRIITNAVRYVAPVEILDKIDCPHFPSLEEQLDN